MPAVGRPWPSEDDGDEDMGDDGDGDGDGDEDMGDGDHYVHPDWAAGSTWGRRWGGEFQERLSGREHDLDRGCLVIEPGEK